MESFVELFNSDAEESQRQKSWDKCQSNDKSISELKTIKKEDSEERLPPEPEQGNVEYKLKLINPSSERFEHLVTQMKWRLREGHGEAVYQIGKE